MSDNPFATIKLAVVMTHPWQGGFFRVACSLCNQLSKMLFDGKDISVLLAVPAGYTYERTHLNPEISVVSLNFEQVASSDERFVPESVRQSLSDLELEIPLITPTSANDEHERLIVDQIDGYILLNPLFFDGAFVSSKPYAVYIADYIQRHVPEIFEPDEDYSHPGWTADRNQRFTLKFSQCAFATTATTLTDVAAYGGVERERLIKFPMFHAGVPDSIRQAVRSCDIEIEDLISREKVILARGSYFLWVTNATAHKNQVRAFEALKNYYAGGGSLNCVICGPVTNLLVPSDSDHPSLQKIYRAYDAMGDYKSRVKISAYIDERTYANVLANAHFLWHNVIYDNGSFSVLEAAQLGTHIVTSRYPQMEYIIDTFGLECLYFDAMSVSDAARTLHQAEMMSAVARDVPLVLPEVQMNCELTCMLERMFEHT